MLKYKRMKAQNFFKKYGENFFSLLAYSSKEIYLESLTLLYDKITKSASSELEREIAVDIIAGVLEKNKQTVVEASDPSAILRRFKECGWIEEEMNFSYKRTIFFTQPALKVIKMIKDLKEDIIAPIDEEYDSTSYESNVYTIYFLLKNYFDGDAHQIVSKIHSEMIALRNSFLSLSSSFKSYLDQSLRQKTVNEILSLHFDRFLNDKASSIYQHLKTADNIFKYRIKINEYLYNMSCDITFMSFLNNAERKKVKELEDFFTTDIELLTREVDHSNRDYIRASINRVKFITSHHEDVKGELTAILAGLANLIKAGVVSEEDEEFAPLANLTNLDSVRYVDYTSLALPSSKSRKFITSTLSEPTYLSPEFLELEMAKFKNHITIESTNNYVSQILDKNEAIYGHQFPLETIDDYLNFLGVIVFSNLDSIKYNLEFIDEIKTISKTTFQDFVVRRQE
jgi:hypothetical protein